MSSLALFVFAEIIAWSAPASQEAYRGDARKGEIQLIEEVGVFKNKWVLFFNDKVRFPNGKEGTYNRVSRPHLAPGKVSGAAVLPMTSDGEVILEEVFRHPIRQWTLEIPRGGWEPGETLQATGERELLEESGYRCEKWEDLGEMFPDTALTEYSVQLFLARGCSPASAATEKTEAIRLAPRPWADVLRMAREGRIKDSISLAAILRAQRLVAP